MIMCMQNFFIYILLTIKNKECIIDLYSNVNFNTNAIKNILTYFLWELIFMFCVCLLRVLVEMSLIER